MTTIPLITVDLDDPPSTADPVNFDSRADNYLGKFPDLKTQQNAMAAAMNLVADEVQEDASDIAASALVAADAAGLVGKMTGSLAVSAGTKAITLTSAKASLAVANKQVVIVLDSDASIKMFGVIASSPTPTSTTFSVTVTSGGVFGSGTYSGWKIIDAAFFGTASTKEELWAGESDASSPSPKSLSDAAAPQTVAYASTLALNMENGRHFRCTAVSASFTLGVFTNAKAGQTFILDLLNSAGSIVLAVNAVWDCENGVLGVLKPDNGARNKIVGIIDEVDGSGNVTRGTYRVMKGLA